MELYKSICYKVENLFVKVMTRKQKSEEVQVKVEAFRQQKESIKQNKKQARLKRAK